MKRGLFNGVVMVAGVALAAGGCASGNRTQTAQNQPLPVRSTLVSSYRTSAGVGDGFGTAVFQAPVLTVARLNNSMGPVYAQVRTPGE